MTRPLYTVGHSTRSLDELVALLEEHGIDLLVDVRRFPGSRRHPWFDREALEATLPARGVEYRHEEPLGGRRGAPSPDSPNAAWENASFRAYADHSLTPGFCAAIERVLALSRSRNVAVMCAEAVPWRCHRRIIADLAVAAGRRVVHVMAPGRSRAHELQPDARVAADGTVTWPAPPAAQGSLFDDG